VPRPFGQRVIDVDDALSIEDVAGRPERFGISPFAPNSNSVGNASHMRRPSSATGVPQSAQLTFARRHAPGPVEHAGIEAEMLDPAGHSTWRLWKIAAHCMGAPCNDWQVRQWQILASTGSAPTS